MKIDAAISRRTLLRQALLALAATTVAGCVFTEDQSNTINRSATDWTSISPDLGSATRLGRAYLSLNPGENDFDVLSKAVNTALTKNGVSVVDLKTEQGFNHVSEVIKTEFARDDAVLVDGWVLSRTEARLYGLIALLND